MLQVIYILKLECFCGWNTCPQSMPGVKTADKVRLELAVDGAVAVFGVHVATVGAGSPPADKVRLKLAMDRAVAVFGVDVPIVGARSSPADKD